ncbi:MAG: AAA family ATPase, partial [Deltaproteobacteria bacterium]|nr:AAA family ATPase [Deltaproteobacteria bacterium]
FEPEAIGGEMEGAGVYAACQDKKVDWILVKAICDWANEKGEDKAARQQKAATNAVAFVLHALEFADVDWKARRRNAKKAAVKFTNTGPGTAAGIANVHGNVIFNPQSSISNLQSSIPTQPFFFGREGELATIADAIHPDSRTWGALVDGPGGIGKTALAIKAAHDAPAAHYPRKIFLSAKVRQLTPKGEEKLEDFMLPNYMALLSELARELGEGGLAKTPENARANALRRKLAGERALLVIDNLETFPEVERTRLYQFLGRLPPGGKAIVTSRRRADLDARAVRLGRLEQKDALALLTELAKTNRRVAQ